MKKTTIILFTILSVGVGKGQIFTSYLNLGGGVCLKPATPTVELLAGVVVKDHLVISGGYQSHLSRRADLGAQFQGRLGVQLNPFGNPSITPFFGISHHYLSSDNKEVNYTRPLYGVEISFPMRIEQGKLYLSASGSGSTYILSGGIKFMFVKTE